MDEQKGRWGKTKIILSILAVYLALPLFIMNTNPEQLPLPLLLVPFLLFFIVLFVSIYLIGSRMRLLKGLERRRQFAVSALLASIPWLLLVFQSLQQLTIRDVLISLSLVVATAFYISRADFLR